ncbi:MAG TPA: hypothetical protein VK845_04830 [Gemmatimonadales bacterium]|nr:hypothetical protein [Gemmatimonadales bacterium]
MPDDAYALGKCDCPSQPLPDWHALTDRQPCPNCESDAYPNLDAGPYTDPFPFPYPDGYPDG